MSKVVFENLRTGYCVSGSLVFKGGGFVPDNTTTNIPGSGEQFTNLRGLYVDVTELEEKKLHEEAVLMVAYGFALNTLALISAKGQTYAYFGIPTRCKYNGISWVLHEGSFEKEEDWKKTQLIGGGHGFATNLDFLNKNKNPRRILHFYREARDEDKPIDYRILQLWRFFEGWFKKRDMDLVNEIVNLKTITEPGGWDVKTNKLVYSRYKVSKRIITSFYRHYRSAVAHGGGAKATHSKKVIYPFLLEFVTGIDEELFYVQKIADEILRRSPRKLY